MAMPIYEIKLFVETDDSKVLDGRAAKVSAAVCDSDGHAEHECPVPWFVITAPVEDADEVRDPAEQVATPRSPAREGLRRCHPHAEITRITICRKRAESPPSL